jgi:hypothetical protein
MFLLIFLFMLLVIEIVLFTIYIRKTSRTYQALEYQFSNDIYCGKKMCEPDIENYDPPEALPTTYDKNFALYCANLVLIVEMNAVKNKHYDAKGLIKVKDLYDISGSPAIGTVWKNITKDGKTVAYVIFRGTQDYEEWVQDFNISQSTYKSGQLNLLDSSIISPSSIQMMKNTVTNELSKNKNIMVHNGFMQAYKKVQSDVLDSLKSIKPDNVVVSGHSLGAAISLIAAVNIYSNGYKNLLLYNYACPRVGNKKFCELVTSMKFPFFRIANTEDIVPNMPPSVSPNIENYKKPYFYQQCGTPKLFSVNRYSILNNHLLGAYVQGMNLL